MIGFTYSNLIITTELPTAVCRYLQHSNHDCTYICIIRRKVERSIYFKYVYNTIVLKFIRAFLGWHTKGGNFVCATKIPYLRVLPFYSR